MNYPQQANVLFSWLLDLIFPIRCIYCGKYGNYACKKCLKSTSIKKSFECIGCARPVNFGKTCFSCSRNNNVDHLFVASDYKDPKIEKIIKLYKYRFVYNLSEPIYSLIFRYLKWLKSKKDFDIFDNPLVLPVPLNRYRLNWRGFNQAELIAEELR